MIDIPAILKDANWDKEEPAKPVSIQKLVDNAGKKLPQDYFALLLYSDGGEGKLGIDPMWFRLWSSADVIELNKSYEVEKYIPGFFGFGSSGGGDLLAFDMRNGEPYKIVTTPFVSMSTDDIIIIANDFEEFIGAIGRDFG